jgi:dihydroflavonol-4-reductase
MPQVNHDAVFNVVKLCQEHPNIVRLVHVSSVHAIPEQPKGKVITEVKSFSPKLVVGKYAKSKAESTQLVIDAIHNGLDAVIVHPSGIIGPNDYSLTHLTQMVLDYAHHKIPAAVAGGYDFVDVRDVADGIIRASDFGKTGECYLLSNKYYTVKQMLDYCQQVLGMPKQLKTLPMWVAKLGLPFLSLAFKLKGLQPL